MENQTRPDEVLAMADQWLSDDEQGDFKSKLYKYLQDKAARRSQVTSAPAYEEMQRQMQGQQELSDAGALAAGLSESASMAGTLNGKRSEVGGLQKFTDSLVNSRQKKFDNFAKMRDMEEHANMNDLNVAKFATGLEQYDDQNERLNATQESNLSTADLQRQALRKKLAQTSRKYTPGIISPSSEPVVMDEEGNPKPLTGYKVDHMSSANGNKPSNWSPYPGVVGIDPGLVYEKDQYGNKRIVELPKGFETPNKSSEGQKKNYVWGSRALDAVGHLEEMEKNYKVGWGRHIAGSDAANTLTGNLFKDKEQQKYDILSANVVDPILRTDTGAAMGRNEIIRNLMQYQVAMGDEPETIRQKQQGRRTFIKSIMEEAGVRGGSDLRQKYENLQPLDNSNYPGGQIEAKRARLRELKRKAEEGN